MSKEFNILISSVGRRVELVKLFKETAVKLNLECKVIGLDLDKTAPALYFCDEYVLFPKVNDPLFIEKLITTCNKFNVKLIVPTIDTELLVYSMNKDYIESKTSAKVLISSNEVIKICRDKFNTSTFLDKNGFNTPILYSEEEALLKPEIYPLFIKPKSGSSSINAFLVESIEKMKLYLQIVDNPIIQKFIDGTEYTVDVFLDFESNIISICPRIRLATRSGEILKGLIDKNSIVIENVKKLMRVLKPIGHITVQLMLKDDKVTYIEINPRFGGGAPMSILAGANSCEFLFKILQGKKLDYTLDYQDKKLFSRFDSCIMLDK